MHIYLTHGCLRQCILSTTIHQPPTINTRNHPNLGNYQSFIGYNRKCQSQLIQFPGTTTAYQLTCPFLVPHICTQNAHQPTNLPVPNEQQPTPIAKTTIAQLVHSPLLGLLYTNLHFSQPSLLISPTGPLSSLPCLYCGTNSPSPAKPAKLPPPCQFQPPA